MDNEQELYQDDFLYDCEKDRVSEEMFEEIEKLKKYYLNHIFFKNDPKRLFNWLSDSLRLNFQEELR